MLEDNIHVAIETVLVTSQPTEGNKPPGKKLSDAKEGQSRDRKRSRDQSQKTRELLKFTPLNISYERLLPIIRYLLEFKWIVSIQTYPS